ncbi:ribosomal L1 domain-containing protein 1 [Rhinoderma darwinii]|uniref:ribosomal L1 domain-containing protein 1 n=1 Tax=Rhinoderma darwinii TaxID=43563 RepID=UPI003F676CF0
MAEPVQHGVDSEQVKKATKALLAYHKTKKGGNSLLLNEHERISLLVTVWKIPSKAQVINIRLPREIRPDTCDVCLFTRDEPNMSVEQTEKFYKKLLSQHGVTQITEIVPLKKMKKEYKPFEGKRRLLSSFDLFLADARIRRLLPSHIGRHFYKEKREPQSVNLKRKNLAAELNRFIQGTQLHVTNRGCCYAIRVGHIGMKAEDIVKNVLAVAQALGEKLPMKWKNVKVLHLKTQSSVALPVYTSSFDSLKELDLEQAEKDKTLKKKKKKGSAKKNKAATPGSEETGDQLPDEKKGAEKNKTDHIEEEEIPQLVPIQTPNSAKKRKKQKTNVQEESKVEGKSEGSEISVKESSTKSPTPKKRKMKVIETPSKHKIEPLSEGKSKEQETPPKRSILRTPKKTSRKSAMKISKSARKAPQTPKLKQKKKMKTPQSV